MAIQNEVLVWSVRVHAHTCRQQLPRNSGDILLQQVLHLRDFFRADLAIQRVCGGDFTFVMHGHLYSVSEIREAIEVPAWSMFPNENGKIIRTKTSAGAFNGFEPE